jgi:hypothetical protein
LCGCSESARFARATCSCAFSSAFASASFRSGPLRRARMGAPSSPIGSLASRIEPATSPRLTRAPLLPDIIVNSWTAVLRVARSGCAVGLLRLTPLALSIHTQHALCLSPASIGARVRLRFWTLYNGHGTYTRGPGRGHGRAPTNAYGHEKRVATRRLRGLAGSHTTPAKPTDGTPRVAALAPLRHPRRASCPPLLFHITKLPAICLRFRRGPPAWRTGCRKS